MVIHPLGRSTVAAYLLPARPDWELETGKQTKEHVRQKREGQGSWGEPVGTALGKTAWRRGLQAI